MTVSYPSQLFFALFCGVLGLTHSSCVGDDPKSTIIGITGFIGQERGNFSEASIYFEHAFPIEAHWFQSLSAHNKNPFFPANLTQLTSLVTRDGIYVSEAKLISPSLTSLFDLQVPGYDGFACRLILTSGPYDVTSTVAIKENYAIIESTKTGGLMLKGLNYFVIEAPEKTISLEVGEDKTLKLTTVLEMDSLNITLGITYGAISKRTKSGFSFSGSYDDIYSYFLDLTMDDVREEASSIEGMSFFMNNETGFGMSISSFDPDVHAGHYCFLLAHQVKSTFDVQLVMQSCFDVQKSLSTEVEKRVIIETCNWPQYRPLEDTANLQLGKPGCIVCTAIGFGNSSLFMVKDIGTVASEPLHWFASTGSIHQIIYSIAEVKKSDEGKYICIALDDSHTLVEALKII